MKNLIVLTLSLTVSTGIFAAQKEYKVLPQNRSLSLQLSKEENAEIVTDDRSFTDLSESALRYEALYAWKAADHEYRGLGLLNLKGRNILVVTDAQDGNGCYYYFSSYGQYLNAFCFTESNDGRWDVE
jgi:hypothetical protein